MVPEHHLGCTIEAPSLPRLALYICQNDTPCVETVERRHRVDIAHSWKLFRIM